MQPLLQATLRAVSTTASLRQSTAALEYIARCFVAGELLEPPEPDGEEEASAADRALVGALRPGVVVAVEGDAGTCDVKLADGTPLQGVAAAKVLALHA